MPVRRSSQAIHAVLALALGGALLAGGCVSRAAPTPAPSVSLSPTPAATAGDAATPLPSAASPTTSLSPRASSSTTIVDGTARTVNETEAWAISVPSTWIPVDLTADDMSAIIDSLERDNPDMAGYLRLLETSGQKISYLAVDPATAATGVPRGVNVIVIPAAGVALDLLGPLTLGTVKQLPSLVGEVDSDKETVGGRPAYVLRYVINVDASGSLQQATRQYLFVEGNRAYVVTMSSDASDDAANAVFDAIADSIEVG